MRSGCLPTGVACVFLSCRRNWSEAAGAYRVRSGRLYGHEPDQVAGPAFAQGMVTDCDDDPGPHASSSGADRSAHRPHVERSSGAFDLLEAGSVELYVANSPADKVNGIPRPAFSQEICTMKIDRAPAHPKYSCGFLARCAAHDLGEHQTLARRQVFLSG
jgi:hypothetical protein